MRTALSPILQQTEAHIRAALPGASIRPDVIGDRFFVSLHQYTFQIAALFSTSYETKATWPIYVCQRSPHSAGI
jgi:hypothetical protein